MADEYDKHRFQADPFKLWKAGYALLPNLSDIYGEASVAIDNTRAGESEAYGKHWNRAAQAADLMALRDAFQSVMAQTATTCLLVGEVLVKISEDYDAADTTNSWDLDSTVADYLNSGDSVIQPPPSGNGDDSKEGGYGQDAMTDPVYPDDYELPEPD